MMEPIRLSFEVACPQAHAFDVWTADIDRWWPADHTVTGTDDPTVVLEPGVGGRICERTSSGIEHDWARSPSGSRRPGSATGGTSGATEPMRRRSRSASSRSAPIAPGSRSSIAAGRPSVQMPRRGATATMAGGPACCRRSWPPRRADDRLPSPAGVACCAGTAAHRRTAKENRALVPARKRRVVYPPPRTSTRQPRPGEPGTPGGPPTEYVRPTVASINLNAGAGRAGLKVGDRVRITGSGLYSGELATIDRLTTGVIPSAVVRTDAGRTRQVRTIDLEPVAGGPPPPAASAEPDAAEG